MPQCPRCRYRFRVMEDEDPASFGCDRCGYGQDRLACAYCTQEVETDEFDLYCSIECEINASNEELETV